MKGGVFLGFIFLIPSCTLIDKPVTTISNFNINDYQGTWYEIARLDHRFERNLTHVTAQYSKSGDHIKVINRGYDLSAKEWRQAIGKAKFIDSNSNGLLKVSFFGPFYGAYQIHDIVTNQQEKYIASLVIGPNSEYAWILSRTKYLPSNTKSRFIEKMKKLGINTKFLIWVNQDDLQVFAPK